MSDSENLGNVEVGKDRAGVSVGNRNRNPLKKADLETRTKEWKLKLDMHLGKKEPSVKQNRSEKDSGNVRAPMYHYLGNVYKNTQKKLELAESSFEELGSQD